MIGACLLGGGLCSSRHGRAIHPLPSAAALRRGLSTRALPRPCPRCPSGRAGLLRPRVGHGHRPPDRLHCDGRGAAGGWVVTLVHTQAAGRRLALRGRGCRSPGVWWGFFHREEATGADHWGLVGLLPRGKGPWCGSLGPWWGSFHREEGAGQWRAGRCMWLRCRAVALGRCRAEAQIGDWGERCM